MLALSVFVLEYARQGVGISSFTVGQTPVTEYAHPDANGPVVVIAHGFAGSQQMMQGYALPLARAGYRVYAFEFLGHGRHPQPMSGDVSSVDGTTRLLVEQTTAVIDAVRIGTPVALLGHSMATDVLVRVAAVRDDIGPVVLISAFSQVIDATTPQNLLLITGAWEPGLRAFGLEALRMVDPDAAEGGTVQNGPITRRTVSAPLSEHVSVLHSRTGRAEALAWLDRTYDRSAEEAILPTGWAILGALAGLVLLFRPVAAVLPAYPTPTFAPTKSQMAVLLIAPALLAPAIAIPLDPAFLPVLVADYLGLHLFIYGVLQLGLLRFWSFQAGRFNVSSFALVLGFCVVFGALLDRYAANFWPTSARPWIICILLIGTFPYMIADTLLTAGRGFWARLLVRSSFLTSLGIAVALDFAGLFFLLMIAPVLVLFYLAFGTMGRCAATRTGPLGAGLALGITLAWALGVSFPLFAT